MPKAQAKILQTKVVDGKMLAKVQFNGKLPQVGQSVNVKWGAIRSLPQNSLYWVFLQWLIDNGGLKEHGHFDSQAFHQNLKKYFLSEKKMSKGEFKSIEDPDSLTTTDMSKSEFTEYIEKVDQFVTEFFCIDTSEFWNEHRENYSI